MKSMRVFGAIYSCVHLLVLSVLLLHNEITLDTFWISFPLGLLVADSFMRKM